MVEEEEIHPLKLLMEDMKSDEAETRIKSMRKLKTVAQALGHDRTRCELIPFLRDSTDNDDEILVALADEVGDFVDLVGGPAHAAILVDPLEVLAGIEETVVRDRAVQSLQKVIKAVPNVGEMMVPLLKRLIEGDWFTSRVSACSLFAPIYSRLVDAGQKKQVRELFSVACSDETPMVRRAAATNIGKVAANLEQEFVVTLIVQLFKALTSDDQDSVRLLAIENCAAIAELLSPEENQQHILPVVKISAEDRSWRVRYSIAKDFFPLSRAMGSQITETELLHCFTTLLQDTEAEVRATSAKNVPGYITLVKFDLFNNEVMPLLSNLAQDTAPNVRTAVSISCMELAPKLGESASKISLSPMLLLFLRDEVVDVRLNVLKRMENLAPWMSSFEDVFLPAIADLARDLQWRVREAVILSIPSLVGSLGTQYFQEHLLDIYLNAYTDMVGEVRLSATKILPQLLNTAGNEFMLQNVLPRLTAILEKSIIYQERVNVLHALEQVASENASGELLNGSIALAIRGAHDKIPNVRFVATKTLKELSKHTDATVVATQVRPCLMELLNDADTDVKYYSSVALDAVQG